MFSDAMAIIGIILYGICKVFILLIKGIFKGIALIFTGFQMNAETKANEEAKREASLVKVPKGNDGLERPNEKL